MSLLDIADSLAAELGQLTFSTPVAHVYNPLVYAREAHALYLEKYGNGPKEAVFVGMNPGPWGMAQTGVPFGEVALVREWLGIETAIAHPAGEHPRKRVEGFSCRRSEVSGRRLWGLFRARFAEPARFFSRFFVVNYCPLLFLDCDGRNITPDKLKPAEQAQLLTWCDRALLQSMQSLRPARMVGVGRFAARRAEIALASLCIPTGQILHPSPANPAANRDWEGTVLAQLRSLEIEL